MLHIITGNGKGKTTASIGMAIRMAGYGKKVLFAQMFKGGKSGEIISLSNFKNITIKRLTHEYGFLNELTENEKADLLAEHNNILDFALNSDFNMIIIDEAMLAVNSNLIDTDKLNKLIDKNCEIVLTGRSPQKWLIDKADYVSEINCIKHPFEKGVPAREGIEF